MLPLVASRSSLPWPCDPSVHVDVQPPDGPASTCSQGNGMFGSIFFGRGHSEICCLNNLKHVQIFLIKIIGELYIFASFFEETGWFHGASFLFSKLGMICV